jgi:N utilization substance protein A
MDIIEWVEDEAQYIANALNPSEVLDVVFDPDNENKVTVIVPDHQLSLAIGKRGQNARLTAKLTGFKIDIKTATQAQEDEHLQAIIAQAAEFAEDEDVYYEDEADAESDDFFEDEANDTVEVLEVVDPEAAAEFEAALKDDTLIEQFIEEEDLDEDE